MKHKILTLEDFDFLRDQTRNQQIGPAMDRVTDEKFFCFNLEVNEDLFDIEVCVNNSMILGFPHGIKYRFKLTGQVDLQNRKAFSFAPTCLSENDLEVRRQLDDFVLLLPDYIFYGLIKFCFSKKIFSYSDIKNVSIIKYIDKQQFLFHGITLENTPDQMDTSRLEINRVLLPDHIGSFYQSLNDSSPKKKEDIIKFCVSNGFPINNHSSDYFFNEERNIWYEASKKGTPFVIGYLRLHTDVDNYPDAFLIEVIVAEKHRGIAVADEMINCIRWVLRENSHANKLIAILPNGLKFSKNTLKSNEFKLRQNDTFKEVYEYDVMEDINMKIFRRFNSN